MPQINVLHLMNSFEDASISRIVLRLVKNLGQKEYCWHVGALSGSGDMQAEFGHSGVRIVNFPEKRTDDQNSNSERIGDYIRNHKIRIIHTHSPRTIFRVALSHVPDAIHISTKHLLTYPNDRPWGAIHTIWDRLSLYMPDQIVAVSETMYERIISQPGIDKRHIAMIRNAIPVDHFYVPQKRDSYRSKLGLPPDCLIIGYAGRIQHVKRIDLLLLAFSNILARFPQARLVIAGEGDLKPQLENHATNLGIADAILWLGFCHEIPLFLAAVDIYVQPSSNEGLSLSILEAMAACKPIIATNVGGANEAVKEAGLLIPPESPSAIIDAISDLLEHPEKRQSLGQAARKRVLEKFNIQSMVESYSLIYQKFAD